MSKPDYDEVLKRLGKIVAKVDKVEETARHGAEQKVWRQLHFLRLEVHRLQNDMRGGDEATSSAES
ncbi:hypothetical protein ACFPH6_04240 [Streptomyces xiangluensis]|uniref:Uncharacterized protein n=1 Tax=Streptomyces xiangluensis TaxID=2665720 RepID=A0ABV8YIV4_9ACTN